MLTELTDCAFAPDGPVHRILGQHRPAQAKIAHQFANLIEDNRGASQATVSLSEQRGGLGKTAAYAIVLMMDISLTGERAAYATYTRALRNFIAEQETIFNTIIRETLEANRVVYRRVGIIEVQSPTAMISPSKCEAIRTRLSQGRIPLDDVQDVREFLNCFDESERPCEFANLYDVLPTLPCGWTELTLALCRQDVDTEDWRLLQEDRQRANDPRMLILLTHSMLIRNNMRNGKLFSEQSESDDIFDVKTVVIDEANKLPMIANTSLRFTVSRNEIMQLVREIDLDRTTEGQFRLSAAIEQFQELLIRCDISYTKEDAIIYQFADVLAKINDALYGSMRIIAEHDVLLAERIRLCRDNLRAIARLDEFEHPILHVSLLRDPIGVPDINATLEIGGGRRLISQMWRSNGFETIVMVSAVLTNMPPFSTRYDRFRRDIDLDGAKGDRFIEWPPMQPLYGGVDRIFVADRVNSLLPTDTEEVTLLRQTSLDGLAAQITAAAMRRAPNERMVVLFQSHIAMHAVLDRLSIRDRVVMRHRQHLPMAIAELVERPHGIWFGVEWEGINFVDPRTQRTMVNTLIITRLPLAPRDEIRAIRLRNAFDNQDRGLSIALLENVHACYQKFYHGLLMGIRSPSDRLDELWILDPRWPLPTHVYRQRPPVIARSLGGSLFTNFDRVVEPWDVQNWYKVDAEGNIETILEPVEVS